MRHLRRCTGWNPRIQSESRMIQQGNYVAIRPSPRRGRWSLALAAVLWLAAGCGQTQQGGVGDSPGPAGGGGKPKVVCTIGMITDVAKIIAADKAEIHGLMKEGVDPHLYQPTLGDFQALDEADLVLYNGLHLEGKMTEVLEEMAAKKPVIAVAGVVPEARLLAFGGNAAMHDMHVWFDVSQWSQVAGAICEGLKKVRPDCASEFDERLKTYQAKLADLHAWCKAQLATVPKEYRVMVTAHDAFQYFGRAYDIEVQGIQGVSTEDEAGLKRINDLVDFLAQRKVKAIFVESSVSPKNIQALVEGCQKRGHPLVIGGELFSDAMGREGTPEGNYEGMIRHNVDVIVKALR